MDDMDRVQSYIDASFLPDDEILSGDNCPVCGYPLVIEAGLEVCYCCGWSPDLLTEERG